MSDRLKEYIKAIPVIETIAKKGRQLFLKLKRIALGTNYNKFPSSRDYWEQLYSNGSNSGPGSYGKLAEFKAEIINSFVKDKKIESIIEFGCGDGNQLKYSNYPNYLGFDVSGTAIAICKKLFHPDDTKTFREMNDYKGEKGDLALSLDVIFHLLEDNVFNAYMNLLFTSAKRFVIIYSSNKSENEDTKDSCVKHRVFTDWMDNHLNNWELEAHIPNRYKYQETTGKGSFSDFYIFRKTI